MFFILIEMYTTILYTYSSSGTVNAIHIDSA